MKTFTIDTDNNISAFPTPDQAEAAVGTGAQPFTSQKELVALAAQWPAERLVAIWNGLPGVKEVKSFKSAKATVRSGQLTKRVSLMTLHSGPLPVSAADHRTDDPPKYRSTRSDDGFS